MFTKVSPLFLLLAMVAVPVKGQELGCFPPVRPFVPGDRRDVEAYSDLIRQDFETYIVDFEAYLRCLDTERARVCRRAGGHSRIRRVSGVDPTFRAGGLKLR